MLNYFTLWDLSSHMGSYGPGHSIWDVSSQTRDGTHTACSGSSESYSLDLQRIPLYLCFFFMLLVSVLPILRPYVRMRVCVLSHFSWLCDLVDYNPPGSFVHGFSRQECWSGLPFPPPRDLPNPGIELTFLRFFTISATWEALLTQDTPSFITKGPLFAREDEEHFKWSDLLVRDTAIGWTLTGPSKMSVS